MSKDIQREIHENNYSLIGRVSLQKYPLLLQKDKIIKGIQRKHKVKDFFSPDEPKKNDKIEEYYSIFNKFKYSVKGDENSPPKKKTKIEFVYKLMRNNPKLSFHNRHLYSETKKKKIVVESDTFSYAPKYEYIRPRLISGPSWKNSKGRKEKKPKIDKRNYYIKHSDFLDNPDSKCLVNMNKTTKRGEFLNAKDIRMRNEKSIDNKDEKNKFKTISSFINLPNNNKNKNNQISLTIENKTKSNNIKLFNRNTKEKFSKTYNNINSYSSRKKKFFSESKIKSNKEKINISINNSSNKKRNKTIDSSHKRKIKLYHNIRNTAPDFKKIMSREQMDKIRESKCFKIPFIVPNYSLVRERPLAMAIYKKFAKVIKNHSPKSKNMEGFDFQLKFDPDKNITSCNNHINLKGPNFKYMLSRDNSESKSSLPSYMNTIHDRGSIYRITEKTLKMNKFKDAKMSSATSSFIPKRSFNKIININMINSHDFNEKIYDEFINGKKEILKTDIERKNKEDEIEFLKDLGTLSQFDNFSYKTIPNQKRNINSEFKHPKNYIYKSIKNLLSIC